MPTPQTEKKVVVLHVRLEEHVAERLKQLASEDDRKLSPFLGRILKQYAEGELVPKTGKKG